MLSPAAVTCFCPEKEGFVMYKSQLQEYAQKAGLMPPTYDHVKEGAPHEPRFKSSVWVNNLKYDSAPGFLTMRSAEHAAAKAALDFLQKNQPSGVSPNSVHESGLCKNLLQEFAQKNGYPLPQYKIMRQGQEHSLVFTATVEIAGVSYSGGGAKNKKEAEIKAARTALLSIQPATKGLAVLEPRPLPAPAQPCQVANFVKSHTKRKKRGRANPLLNEEPLATRMKHGVGYIPGPVQPPQIYPIPQGPQVSQIHLPPVNQVGQIYPVNPVGYSGEIAMPVLWNQELGVRTRPVFSEPMQLGQAVALDIAMTKSEFGAIPAAVQGIAPTLDTTALHAGNNLVAPPGDLEMKAAVISNEPLGVGQVAAQDTTLAKSEFGTIPVVVKGTVSTLDFNVVNGENYSAAPLGNTENTAAVILGEGLATQNPIGIQQGEQVPAEVRPMTRAMAKSKLAAPVQGTAPPSDTDGGFTPTATSGNSEPTIAGANGATVEAGVAKSRPTSN